MCCGRTGYPSSSRSDPVPVRVVEIIRQLQRPEARQGAGNRLGRLESNRKDAVQYDVLSVTSSALGNPACIRSSSTVTSRIAAAVTGVATAVTPEGRGITTPFNYENAHT
jgi:hypothetical protein